MFYNWSTSGGEVVVNGPYHSTHLHCRGVDQDGEASAADCLHTLLGRSIRELYCPCGTLHSVWTAASGPLSSGARPPEVWHARGRPRWRASRDAANFVSKPCLKGLSPIPGKLDSHNLLFSVRYISCECAGLAWLHERDVLSPMHHTSIEVLHDRTPSAFDHRHR